MNILEVQVDAELMGPGYSGIDTFPVIGLFFTDTGWQVAFTDDEDGMTHTVHTGSVFFKGLTVVPGFTP